MAEQIADVLRERILAGDASAGQALRQEHLAAEFGISKIPIREALARLEQEGLVRNEANRGYYVCALDLREAEEICALRLTLEPGAVALAAKCADDVDRNYAMESFYAMAHRYAALGQRYWVYNRAFHLALIRPSRQLVTVTLLVQLYIMSERYIRKSFENAGAGSFFLETHEEILRLWLDRDGKAVGKAMRAHTQQIILDLRRDSRNASDRRLGEFRL